MSSIMIGAWCCTSVGPFSCTLDSCRNSKTAMRCACFVMKSKQCACMHGAGLQHAKHPNWRHCVIAGLFNLLHNLLIVTSGTPCATDALSAKYNYHALT